MSLAELFFAKHPRRSEAVHPRRRRRIPRRRRLLFEPLESRLLLSADPTILLVPALDPNAPLDEPVLVLEPEATPQPTATVDSTATDAPTSGEFVDPPIALAPKAALLAGLQGLGNWAETLDTFTQFAQDLPVVGQSLGETLDIGNILLTRLYDRVNAYFTGDGTPTTDELVVALKNLDATVGNLTVAVDDATVAGGLTGANQFRFDLVFEATRTINAVPINLGANAQALGLGVDASLAATVDLTTSLHLDFSFGLRDLDPATFDLTLPAADSFFIQVSDFIARADVHGSDLSFEANVGFLGVQVQRGRIDLDADLAIALTDPDADGRITLAELQGASIGSLASLTGSGSLDATLPVEVTLGGFSTAETINVSHPVNLEFPPPGPTIKATSGNVFGGGAPDINLSDFEDLLDFDNLAPADVLNAVKQLGTWLNNFRDSSIFDTRIPFTQDKTLGDVLDFATAFADRITDQLEAVPPGEPAGTPKEPNFETIQDLAAKLASSLRSDQSAINANYDAATHELTFRVGFTKPLASLSLPIDLGLDLGALGGITTSSTLGLDATVSGGLTFGIK